VSLLFTFLDQFTLIADCNDESESVDHPDLSTVNNFHPTFSCFLILHHFILFVFHWFLLFSSPLLVNNFNFRPTFVLHPSSRHSNPLFIGRIRQLAILESYGRFAHEKGGRFSGQQNHRMAGARYIRYLMVAALVRDGLPSIASS